MAFSKASGAILVALAVAPFTAMSAQAAPLVTYTWTTTSEGFGPIVGEPSSATFQVPLSEVQSGVIHQFAITNIQLAYPGLSFAGAAPSSIGLDAAAYVDPVSGNFIFHSNDQGLAVFAYAPDLFSYDTFLSITVDNPVSGAVADQFNAMDHFTVVAGYPTAGHWTASLPEPTPLPPALPLFVSSIAALGVIAWRRKRPNEHV